MKPVNIVILILAGAIGGAVVMKLTQRPRVETAAVETPAAPPVTPAAALQQPAPPAAPPEASPAASAAPAPQRTEREVAPAPVRKAAPAKPAASRREYSNARPSPFHKDRIAEPPVEVAQTTAPAEQPAPAAPVQAPAESPTPPVRPEPVTPAPAAQPVPNTVTLNAGMLIPVRLLDGLSSDRNAPGDAFLATLDHELVADGFVIAERGARVEGRVVTVDRGTKTRGGATLVVELTRLHTSDNQNVPIQTESFEKRSEPSRTTDAEKVGGGAALGAIIGAIAGGGKGAAIGAGVGGGAGAGDVLLTRKPATLPSETRITFRLKTPVTLTEKLG